jgi:hypothetical protein
MVVFLKLIPASAGISTSDFRSPQRFFVGTGYWFRYEAQIGQNSPRISPPPSEHQKPDRRLPASMSISPPYISQPQGVNSDNTKASGKLLSRSPWGLSLPGEKYSRQ